MTANAMTSRKLFGYVLLSILGTTLFLSCTSKEYRAENHLQSATNSNVVAAVEDNSHSANIAIGNVLQSNSIVFDSQTPALNNETTVSKEGVFYLPLFSQSQSLTGESNDNMQFEFYLPDSIGSHSRVFLHYSLQGVSDYTSLCSRINSSPVFEGKDITVSSDYSTQLQEIPSLWLEKGRNIFRFQMPKHSRQGFSIKDMQLQIVSNEDIDNNFADIDNSDIKYNFADIGIHSIKPLIEQEVSPESAFDISLENIRITGAAHSLSAGRTLSVSALRSIDMAVVSSDMFNVTSGDAGYRLLPDGTHFEKDIVIALKYDTLNFKDGYHPEDIFTFYYDEGAKSWQRIDRDSIDYANHIIYSHTNHFTDYINGILKTPELPDVQAYTPTMIKDLQAAHPHNGIANFSVPEANNKGTANTSMPLWLPAGRGGMQPNLNLAYNSGGGNGWLGQGWDIGFSSIEVETRWGVPLYNPTLETETYLLDGETLVLDSLDANQKIVLKKPTYRRNFEQRKTGTVRFYRRVEGAFQKIERTGTSPKNYQFTVTGKDGTKYFYGKNLGYTNETPVLTTTEGDIGKWMLTRIEDTYGNFVNFMYNQISVNGGKQLYISRINYTGNVNTNEQGKYDIYFNLASTPRPDVTSNARKGMLEMNSKLLDNIQVIYNNDLSHPLRTYYFGYKTGAYGKTLLSNVLDADSTFKSSTSIVNNQNNGFTNQDVYARNGDVGTLHNNNDYFPVKYWFEYNQDLVQYNTNTVKEIQVHSDQVPAILPDLNYYINMNRPVLQGSITKSWDVGGTLSAGYGYGIFWKKKSVGGNYIHSEETAKSFITFIDLNGDGYPDKLFKDRQNRLKYRLHKIDANGASYFDNNSHLIDGLSDFTVTRYKSNGFGIEGQCVITLGYQYAPSSTNTVVYFSDVNGDGLPDIVDAGNNRVFFNQLVDNYLPSFKELPAKETAIRIEGATCKDDTVSFSGIVNEAVFQQGDYYIQYEDSCYMLPASQCSVCNYLPHPKHSDHAGDTCVTVERRIYAANEPLYEPDIQSVRCWIAPYSGNITIVGHAWLTDDLHRYRYDNKIWDGVILNIQKSGATDNLWRAKLSLTEADSLNNNIYRGHQLETYVNAGDIIYFRMESCTQRALDVVKWYASIRYLGQVTNDKGQQYSAPLYNYNAADNFLLNVQNEKLQMPFNGKIKIVAAITAPALTEKLVFYYKINGQQYLHTFAQGQAINYTDTIINNLIVSQGDSLSFRLECPGKVDWANIKAKAEVHYLSASYVNEAGTAVSAPVSNNINDPDYNNYHFTCAVSKRTFHYAKQPSASVNNYSCAKIRPTIKFSPGTINAGKIRVTLKNSSGVNLKDTVFSFLATSSYYATDINLTTDNTSINGIYYIDYYVDNAKFGQAITKITTDLKNASGTVIASDVQSGLYTNYFDNRYRKFENIYNSWSQFGYKPANKNLRYIDESLLNLNYLTFNAADTTQTTPVVVSPNLQPEDAAPFGINPLSGNFFIMSADMKNNRYVAYNENASIKKDTMSNMGAYQTIEEAIIFAKTDGYPVAYTIDNPLPKTVWKKSKSKVHSGRGGVSLGVSIGVSGSYTDYELISDYMDINGDRYPDVIGDAAAQYSKPQGGLFNDFIKYNINTGNIDQSSAGTISANASWIAATVRKSSETNPKQAKIATSANAHLSYSSDETSTTWVDINGDGLPDKVVKNGENITVYYNLGYKFANAQTITGNSIRKSASLSGGGGSSVQFGNLDEFLGNNPASSSVDFEIAYSISGGMSNGYSKNNVEYMLMDINNDGLPDRLRYENPRAIISNAIDVIIPGANLGHLADNDNLYVAYNTGNGFGSEQPLTAAKISQSDNYSFAINGQFTVGFTIGMIPLKFLISLACGGSASVSAERAQLMDFNNDGYPDIVTSGEKGKIKVIYAIPKPTNLLKSISSPANLKIKIEYAMSENSTVDNPSRSWVMSACEQHTVAKGASTGGIFTDGRKQRQEFEYKSRRYNRFEREDYGFDTVRTKIMTNNTAIINPNDYMFDVGADSLPNVYQIIEQQYNSSDFLFKGLLQNVTVKNANNVLFSKQEYTYWAWDITTGDSITADNAHCLGLGSAYPALREEKTTQYENGRNIQTRKEYGYGRFGNVDYYNNLGNINSPDDNISAAIEYNYDYEATKYITGQVNRLTYRAAGSNYNYIKTSKINDKGSVIEITTHGSSGVPDAVTAMQYDSYGNITRITVPAGYNITKYKTFEYDNVLHSLVTSVTDNLGYTSSATYDYRWQAPLTTTDIGGAVMRYKYDTKGRVKSVKSPKDPDYTVKYSYWDMVSGKYVYYPYYKWVITLNYNAGNTDIEIITHADGFSRIFQTAKHLENNYYSITGLNFYDYTGNVVYQTTEPYIYSDFISLLFMTRHNSYPNISNHVHFRHYNYDSFGRVISVKEPDGTVTQTNYDIVNSEFKTSVTDALGNQSHIFKDVRGLTTKTISPLGAQTLFEYDGLGQLLQTTDPENHSTYYHYDILGRTVGTEHPSRGNEWYDYDGATSNIAVYTNANGRIYYQYDNIGRLTETHYSDNPQNDVYYLYENPNNGYNSGRLVKVQDATGVTDYEYGDMGEVTAQNRMHILPTGDWLTLRTQWEYDSWGRTRSIIYPDSEEVHYGYNQAGLLNRIISSTNGDYISDIEYNKNEQKTFVNYGNNTVALYGYDPVMWRLETYNLLYNDLMMHTMKILMHKDYQYNDIGNISYLNSRYIDADIDINEEFQYDSDNQLISAIDNGSNTYHLNMQYSPAGRIEQKNFIGSIANYSYNDPNNPYAVTLLDKGRVYSNMKWDKAGNLCFEEKVQLKAKPPIIERKFFSWTEDNRMQGFYNETQKIAALYRYDASGERELKLTAKVQDIWTQNMGYQKQPIFDNATLYASPLMTINGGGYVKHYFAGTERILANVAGRGQAMIGVDEPLKPIAKNTTPEELAKEYYTFVSSYFNKKANENACVDNGIIFDAVIDLPSMQIVYDKVLHNNMPDRLYYFNANHLGSGSLITDESGATYQTLAYAPHGEILVNDFAGDYDEPYKFTGYERDQESGLDYAHARYREPDKTIFYSTDPMWFKYPHITPYNYAGNNPSRFIDPDGRDAIYIAFPNYKIQTPIGKIGGLGHAGVLLIDNKTGLTKYYEYGRYDKEEKGLVRSFTISNVVIKDGKPTTESLNKVLQQISEKAGHGGDIEGAYIISDKFKEMNDYAKQKMAENSDPKRKSYNLLTNNCGTFAEDVITQDKSVDKPTIINTTPINIVNEYQEEGNARVQYNSQTKTTTIGTGDEKDAKVKVKD